MAKPKAMMTFRGVKVSGSKGAAYVEKPSGSTSLN